MLASLHPTMVVVLVLGAALAMAVLFLASALAMACLADAQFRHDLRASAVLSPAQWRRRIGSGWRQCTEAGERLGEFTLDAVIAFASQDLQRQPRQALDAISSVLRRSSAGSRRMRTRSA